MTESGAQVDTDRHGDIYQTQRPQTIVW